MIKKKEASVINHMLSDALTSVLADPSLLIVEI